MPTLSASNIPTPKSWDEFEDIALSSAKLRWATPNFYRHGRAGQRQDGVDVYGSSRQGGGVGLQGKNTVGGVSEGTVVREVAAAESFQPPLDELFIVTTAKRDAAVQKAVRNLSAERRKQGKFTVDILFWDDIVNDLLLDEAVFRQHYPQLGSVKDPAKEHDRALADELLRLLSSKGVIGFLENNNMAGFPYHYDRFQPLRDFVYDWNKPEKEFIIPELEQAKMSLWAKADVYFDRLAINTYPLDTNPDFHSVPAEWETEQPTRFWKVVNEFHALAGEIVTLHAEFSRTVKRVLVGKPPAAV